MDVDFDKGGFFYCVKAVFLIVAVFFVGNFASGEYAEFVAGPVAAGTPAYAAAERSLASAPQEPEYQELAQADGIFANGEEGLVKRRELSECGEGFIYIFLVAKQL